MLTHLSAHRFADAIILEEAVIPWKVRLALLLTIGASLLFSLWSTVTRIDEAVKTNGQFMPRGQVYKVQAAEAGLLSALFVKEGDQVEKGALLVHLKNTSNETDQKQAQARLAGLQARRIRLQALLTGAEADFSSIAPEYGDVVRDQSSLLRTQLLARETSLSVLETQLTQKRTECEQLTDLLRTARGRVEVDQASQALQDELASKNLVSKVVQLNAKRTLLASQAEVNRLGKQLEKARQSLEEVQTRRRILESEGRQQASDELGQVNNDIAQTNELLTRLQERQDQLELYASVSGVVQGVKTRATGAVVKAGDTLLQIVPSDAELMMEVRIPPEHIGFVQPGQPVVIKVATYDFQRFGTVSGRLTAVSPSTEQVVDRLVSVANKDLRPHYLGWIKPDTRFVGKPEYPILPGMQAEADIITGHRSVLVYLLKPLLLPEHVGGEKIEEIVRH
ncbi:MAG: HlyD family type I secretion periplasmic adaptor subunit [Magnetococcus sp. XQGC-1]